MPRPRAAVVREATAAAEAAAASQDSSSTPKAVIADSELARQLPLLLSPETIGGAEFALYNQDLEPIWYSSPAAMNASQQEDRARAQRDGSMTRTIGRPGNLFEGLVDRARLSVAVVHEPVILPGGELGVLDVTYFPTTEEQAIDSVRLPMTALAISAMVIMVTLMQTSMVWVLRLVDNLRKAADDIDAGRLDQRLPDAGRQRDRRACQVGQPAHRAAAAPQRGAVALCRRREPRTRHARRGHPRLHKHPARVGRRGPYGP